LGGWYARRCDQYADDARKEVEQHAAYAAQQVQYGQGGELHHRYAAGEAQAKVEAWEARAAAARSGNFLFDQAGQRDTWFLMQPDIKNLRERAAEIGLVQYEKESRELGTRY
jgi:hypothetical protein